MSSCCAAASFPPGQPRVAVRRPAFSAATLALALAVGLPAHEALAQTVVTMWVHAGPGPERQVYVESVKAFNRKNPNVRVELVSLPEGSYTGHVEAAARTQQLPCLLDFDGPHVYHLASLNRLVPLDELPFVQEQRRKLLRTVERQGTYAGRLYSIGQYDSGLAMWGNKRLLERAGARLPKSTRDPWTLEEFEALLARLKAQGVVYPLDLKLNYGIGEWLTYGLSPIVQSFGGDLIDRSTMRTAKGAINGAGAIKAMETVQGWVQRGYVNAATASDDDFVKGHAALSYVGHWTYKSYRTALGDDLVLIPMPRFGSTVVTGAGSWNWGISKDCRAPAAAARVLEHLISKDEVLRVTSANAAVPATLAAIAFSTDHAPGGPLRVHVDQILEGTARLRPQTPAYPAITQAFAEAAKRIINGADVKAELDRAAARIDTALFALEAARTR